MSVSVKEKKKESERKVLKNDVLVFFRIRSRSSLLHKVLIAD
jgi:hypothetical protein